MSVADPQPPFSWRRWSVWHGYASALLACALALPLASTIDTRLLDLLFKLHRQFAPSTVQHEVVVVGIDDAFIDSIDVPMTLSHRYLASFLQTASANGAAVIGVDVILPEKRFDQLVHLQEPGLDFHMTLLRGLHAMIGRTPLVLAKAWDYQRGHFIDIHIDYAAVLAMQDPAVRSSASALFQADGDGRIRHYPDRSRQPDRTPFTLSSELAAAVGSRREWEGLINYQIGPEFSYIPIQKVFKAAKDGDSAQLKTWFNGKIVLLGSVMAETDLVTLPVPMAEWRPGDLKVPGVLFHAQAVRTMLNRGFIEPVAQPLLWLGALLFSLFWFHAALGRKAVLLALLSAGLLLLTSAMLRRGVWLMPTALLTSGWIALLARAAAQSWQQYRARQRLSASFAGYVSPGVMQQILQGGIDARKDSHKLAVCVLFSDVRNFTTMSEQLSAEQVVQLLNRYFARMTAVVHRHGGTVDKFIGDGMMAFFGAPNQLPSAEKAALEAARDMLAELAELNRDSLELGAPQIEIGIGLHSGPAVIGYIGSDERHEYTAIGDTVNIASRIEGLCKQLGKPILCSQAVAAQLNFPAMLTDLGPQAIKGRSAVHVYGWAPL